MKKVLLVAAVAGFSMVSCKKVYTCECSTTSTMPGYTPQTVSVNSGKMKKKDAEAWCNTGDTNSSAGGYTSTQECNIK